MVVCIALQCFCLGVAIVDLMIQIVLYEMFRSVPKGRHEADPYGDIEIVVCCRGRPCACPGCVNVVSDGKMIGEMVAGMPTLR